MHMACSIYDWTSNSFLWTPSICLLSNVSYAHRVDQPESYNYCTVPQHGTDAFLFASLALLAGACALGKLAVVWVLLAGRWRGVRAAGERGHATAGAGRVALPVAAAGCRPFTPHPTRRAAGGALGAASYWANLRQLGNGVALWLGISPPDLFFYAVRCPGC